MDHNDYLSAQEDARSQWEPETSGPDHDGTKENTQPLSLDMMWEFWQKGAIGYKEFRNWLAREYPSFEAIRDSSVDDRIDEVARSHRFLVPEEKPDAPSAPPTSR